MLGSHISPHFPHLKTNIAIVNFLVQTSKNYLQNSIQFSFSLKNLQSLEKCLQNLILFLLNKMNVPLQPNYEVSGAVQPIKTKIYI